MTITPPSDAFNPQTLPPTDAANRWVHQPRNIDTTLGFTTEGQFLLTFREGGLTYTVPMPPERAVELGQQMAAAASSMPTSSGLYLPPGARLMQNGTPGGNG